MDPNFIQPLADRVLVKAIIEEETRGGVILPYQVSEGRPEKARVLAVGPGRLIEKTGQVVPVPLEVGDVVIFHRHSGTHVGGLDDSYIIFREQDILCRITDPAFTDNGDAT